MTLGFPLRVNGETIGRVEIVRRDDPITPAGEYTYDWNVYRQPAFFPSQELMWDGTGELKHVYADGAFELIYEVLAAYLGEPNDRTNVSNGPSN